MESTARSDQDLIHEYLAGRLGEAEREMAETRIVRDPDFRSELELTEALRAGLRELQTRGEIANLLAPRRSAWATPWAAAAAVAAVTVGAAWFLSQQLRPTDGSTAALASSQATETLRFERLRGPAPVLDWNRPDPPPPLELRFDVGLSPAASYRVHMERRGTSESTVVFSAPVATSAAGDVVILLHSARLGPGDYRIHLEPQGSSAGEAAPGLVYGLRISR